MILYLCCDDFGWPVGPSLQVLHAAPSLGFTEFEDLAARVSLGTRETPSAVHPPSPPSPAMQTSRNQTCQTMIRIFQVELKVIVLAF